MSTHGMHMALLIAKTYMLEKDCDRETVIVFCKGHVRMHAHTCCTNQIYDMHCTVTPEFIQTLIKTKENQN
jgi:hypothetical protein